MENRAFKGIWIPKEIWLSKELSITEKLLLVEIDSLDNKDGCFASNKYFSEFFDLSIRRIQDIISGLVNKGFITLDLIYKKGSKEVEKRIMRVTKKIAWGHEENFTTPPAENFVDNNTINYNKDYNKESNDSCTFTEGYSSYGENNIKPEELKPEYRLNKITVNDTKINKDQTASEIYEEYMKMFPWKKNKRATAIARIKDALKKFSKDDLIKFMKIYLDSKKETIQKKEYGYIKTCENFFGNDKGSSVKFIENFVGIELEIKEVPKTVDLKDVNWLNEF